MSETRTLAGFQAAIAAAVMRPLGGADLMDERNRSTAAAFIRPNDRLDAFERLQIYNQQYWWRILGSFSEDFPGLRAVLGSRRFERLAIRYLEDTGSRSWNLRDLGIHLVPYLRTHPELTTPFTDLALDMASVEWARVAAFDAEHQAPLDQEKIRRLVPETLRLGLQPHITLLELRHPIERLLRRLKHSEAAPASNTLTAPAGGRAIRLRCKPSPRPIHLAVHRVDLIVYYKRLEPQAFRILRSLQSGANLGEACESAFSTDSASPAAIARKVGDWFNAWTRFGWLI